MWDFLKKFFIFSMFVNAINRLPPLRTFIMDLIYPESVRFNHPFDKLAQSDLGLPEKNIPLITRGSSSYPVPLNKTALKLIEPANITPSIVLTASEINTIRSLGLEQQQQVVDKNINKLRKITRKTTEAMAIQSITGKIAYDIRNADGTMDTYEVDFGTPKTISIAKKWNASGTTVGDITLSIGQIVDSLGETSDGTDIVYLCGFDVYSALVAKAATLNNPELIKVFDTYVQIGTVKFIICSAKYFSYKTKTNVKAIPAKSVVAIAKDDSFSLAYCTLDSFDANFAALAFYVNAVKQDDPEAMKLIGQSRPMPIPNVDAIRIAQVLE
jgi:hypothetical protein